MNVTNRLFGAILLIIGTTVGAAMIALPVSTAAYGFWPSTILFIVCWAVMVYCAYLILEVNLWLPLDSNMISMAKMTLGKTGQAIAWAAYLLLLYSLMAAYLSGMNAVVTNATSIILHEHIANWIGSILLVILFGAIIYLGAKTIDGINRLLIIGLAIAFVALISTVSPLIKSANIQSTHFNLFWLALPVAVTSFGFHIIIPSLRSYLRSDVNKLRLAILIGSTVPLLVYLLWELVIIGVVPKHQLLAILHQGQPAIGLPQALNDLLGHQWISTIARFFGFFAIATSFIGVSFSLFDFLADGFSIKKTRLGRLSTALITFIPPLLYALIYPHGFIIALGYAGIFVVILLCIMPAAMAWRGRARQKQRVYQTIGGKLPLLVVVLFAAIVIVAEWVTNFN